MICGPDQDRNYKNKIIIFFCCGSLGLYGGGHRMGGGDPRGSGCDRGSRAVPGARGGLACGVGLLCLVRELKAV